MPVSPGLRPAVHAEHERIGARRGPQAVRVQARHDARVLIGHPDRADLSDLAREAPPNATLVVFHTAVLIYIRDRVDREAFARSVADLGAVWVAMTSPSSVRWVWMRRTNSAALGGVPYR